MRKISTIILTTLTLILTIGLTYFFAVNQPKSDIKQYNLKNSVLIEYNNFDKLINAVSNNEETYYLYFGKPECSYCMRYLPIVNEVLYDSNIPLLYYNAERVKGTYKDEEGNLKLNSEYEKIINWIKENSIVDAKENNWIGKRIENNVTLEWLMVPRFFKVENGKITNCFKSNSEAEEVYKQYENATDNANKELYYANFKKIVKSQIAIFMKETAKASSN